jgi:6-phosphogluconolactonase
MGGDRAEDGLPYVYVGQGNGEIAIFLLDRDTGELALSDSIAAGDYPSFLAIDPSKRFLYAAEEGSSEIAAFAIDAATATLTPINSVSSQGAGPAYVSVDRSGAWVLAANYGGGTVAVFPVAADGSLGNAIDTGSPGNNPHLIRTDPTNQFAFVPVLGSDIVAQFLFDASDGSLDPNAPPAVSTPTGAGPRHLDFHPTAPFVYVINELDSTLSVYALSAAGTLAPVQTLSTLPEGFDPSNNTCADVHVSNDGKFVYGSNRGHDSIVIFAADPATGMLTLVGHQSTGGATPRNFGLDPAGGVLLVANQESNNVVSFRRDPTSGMLTELVTTELAAKPFWVGVVPLPQP